MVCRFPPPDPEGTRCFGNICISDEVLNKYGPLPRGERIPCMACFRYMNKSPWYECLIQQGRRVCDWCDLSEHKRCIPVSLPFL